jgi:carbamate kinase
VRIVVALGGNALLRRGEPVEPDVQRRNVARAAHAVARLAAEHSVVVTHGNGPQVGLLALQSASAPGIAPWPLDVLDAQTEGMIGYLIEQELQNRLPGRDVVTLLTQVEVARDDPAFLHPAKPIGPCYEEAQAKALAKERGWSVARDGPAWRRVVPSPEPLRIREISAIRLLLASGAIVVCAGGGGIPVTVLGSGAVCGVEAVIDKDLCASLLARELSAQALLLLTDVDAVYADWGTPRAEPIRCAEPRELRGFAFEPGSMAPKVEAACRFVERGGERAGIGLLEDAFEILAGRRGTLVRTSRRERPYCLA